MFSCPSVISQLRLSIFWDSVLLLCLWYNRSYVWTVLPPCWDMVLSRNKKVHINMRWHIALETDWTMIYLVRTTFTRIRSISDELCDHMWPLPKPLLIYCELDLETSKYLIERKGIIIEIILKCQLYVGHSVPELNQVDMLCVLALICPIGLFNFPKVPVLLYESRS